MTPSAHILGGVVRGTDVGAYGGQVSACGSDADVVALDSAAHRRAGVPQGDFLRGVGAAVGVVGFVNEDGFTAEGDVAN